MKKAFIWLAMLNKRLYKKPTFLCLLLVIPLMVVLFQNAAQEKAGILTVALALENPKDSFAAEFARQLSADASVISFIDTSPEMAVTLVETGKADAAWILPDNLKGRIEAYAAGKSDSGGFIRVVEREQTVPLRLSREKLSGRIYEHTAEAMFLQYLRTYAPQTESVDDRLLLSYLDATHVSGELFAFYDIYGNQREETANYLYAPLRGMLAVWTVLGAVVTAMYYQKDLDRGLVSLIPQRFRFAAELGYHMVSVTNLLAAVLISLVLSGLAAAILQELFLLVFFGLGCCLFAMVLRMLTGGRRALAVWMPVLTAIMLVVCPVFFDFAPLRFLQYLLPPTYYIAGAYHLNSALYLLAYDGILLLIYLIGTWIKEKIPKYFVFNR